MVKEENTPTVDFVHFEDSDTFIYFVGDLTFMISPNEDFDGYLDDDYVLFLLKNGLNFLGTGSFDFLKNLAGINIQSVRLNGYSEKQFKWVSLIASKTDLKELSRINTCKEKNKGNVK